MLLESPQVSNIHETKTADNNEGNEAQYQSSQPDVSTIEVVHILANLLTLDEDLPWESVPLTPGVVALDNSQPSHPLIFIDSSSLAILKHIGI